MPRNKDQKRKIRSRMQKTGEAYTAARAVILSKPKASQASYAAPRSEWPALAGIRDDAVEAKTGRTWAGWVEVLDGVEAHRLSHAEIARHLAATFPDLGGWWSQTITVAYERIRGLRDVGQRRGGGYQAGKTRTFAVDVETLFRMFDSIEKRGQWLGEGVAKVRSTVENRSVRADWQDGSRVLLTFLAKGPGKSALNVEHTHLASKADAERAKAFWHERLDALREVLR